MAEEESAVEGEATGPPDQFVGHDPLESYNYWINYEYGNPLARYVMLIKAITFGMELLPDYDDEKKQETIKALYAKASEVLKTEIPAKRTVEYGYVNHGGERFKVYKIRASESKDAGEYQVLEKDFKDGMNNFISMQHEQHISKLQAVHNQILHELTQSGIVQSINPTVEQMKEGRKKKN
ncbi:unnamed protein product [marine sediment metagenome]|uniref:Uncharacterized protein n=1 Tax=marine sediment metagenome TaxID=412755 RepID=X1DIS7_9ZZZZ